MKVYEVNYDKYIYGAGICNTSRYVSAENETEALQKAKKLFSAEAINKIEVIRELKIY